VFISAKRVDVSGLLPSSANFVAMVVGGGVALG